MLEDVVPLDPVHFFAFQCDCFYLKNTKLEKKHILSDLSGFYDSRPFSEVSIGWNEKGIHLQVAVKGAFETCDFPNFMMGDSIEFFFDTRDVKTAGYTTRFCHHFFFLPEPIQTNGSAVQAGEITRFRKAEETHELCDATLLKIDSKKEKNGRLITIFIPAECLYGYDPTQFDRLGFTYRINRVDGSRQYFSATDADFSIESQPSLWASLKLIKVRT